MNFGQNIYEFVQTNVTPLFLAVLVCVKREGTKFISFVLIAIVVAGFVFAPDLVRDILVNIFKSIFRT